MWSNDDETGRKTSMLAFVFSLCLTATMLVPFVAGAAGLPFLASSVAVTLAMVALAIRFLQQRDRKAYGAICAYLP